MVAIHLNISTSLCISHDVSIPLPFVCDGGSYLAEKIYKRPVIIYEHPKEVKPFYVRIRDDGKTVSTFDIIAPKVNFLCSKKFKICKHSLDFLVIS